ncbi:MAG: DUF177 domain-containing protein [Clostridiales bacterium]|nr:DUF177 domain-containing protein [Clostridiales bacterium]
MLLDISDVVSCENKERTEQVLLGLTSFTSRLGDFSITEKAPIELTIRNRENKKLLIYGEVDLTVQIPCSRCLTEVPTGIRFTVDKEFPIRDARIDCDEPEGFVYLIEGKLDTDKLIYEEILINWPAKILCREGCKGICTVCGTDLNEGTCDCASDCAARGPDPRMAAIQDIFNKFKEV